MFIFTMTLVPEKIASKKNIKVHLISSFPDENDDVSREIMKDERNRDWWMDNGKIILAQVKDN